MDRLARLEELRESVEILVAGWYAANPAWRIPADVIMMSLSSMLEDLEETP